MLFPSLPPRLSCGPTLCPYKILPAAAPLLNMPRETPFNVAHEIGYGLTVASLHPGSSNVVSVNCLFCIHFGRKDTAVAQPKRRKTENDRTFTAPFRTDNYVQHMRRQPNKTLGAVQGSGKGFQGRVLSEECSGPPFQHHSLSFRW